MCFLELHRGQKVLMEGRVRGKDLEKTWNVEMSWEKSGMGTSGVIKFKKMKKSVKVMDISNRVLMWSG